MKNEPLVSIAMATYNGEKYLKEQLDSIYAQTYKNIEVIVTDDCSTDKTVEILEQYSKLHGLKYFVNTQNLGFVKNFEKVIRLCSGEYISLADQDDIWLQNKLEILLHNIKGSSLVFSDAKLINENGDVINDSFVNLQGLDLSKQLTWQNLLFKNYATGCTILFHNSLLKKALPFPAEAVMHDWWLAEVASLQNSITYVDIPLILYRQHAGSVTGISLRETKLNIFFLIFKRFFDKKHSMKYQYSLLQVRRLKGMLNDSRYCNEQLRDIENTLSYYRNYINYSIHPISFYYALKYFKVLGYSEKRFVQKIKLLVLELIG